MSARLRLTLIVLLILATSRMGAADDLALYREGVRQFQNADHVAAGRALSQLAPFTQEFGEHARYLLARVHDLCGERPEAIALYEAIIDYHMSCRADAANALSRPDSLKDRADEKARLEAVLQAPTPQDVVRSRFYCGRLLVQEGRYEDAIARLSKALQNADGALAGETKFWLAVAQVQTKRFDEAIANLSARELDIEAMRWLARAHVGVGITPVQRRQNGAGILPSADERKAGLESAIAALKKAVELQDALRDSRGPFPHETRTKMELADLLRQAGRFEAAAATYAEAGKESADPQLAEIAKYRNAVALQLAGKISAADAALEQFAAEYPRSALLADAAVRYAENALLGKRFDVAMARFTAVGGKYPATEQAHLATLGIAGIQYQLGHFDQAVKTASQIPESERLGDLAAANYLIADCQLRNLPQEPADDALATARLISELTDLGDRFKSFMLAHETEPQSVDAALKLGYCLQWQASLIVEPIERRKALSAARRMYMGLMRQFPDHPLYPIIMLESARCTSLFGSRMAENELARFEFEPLRSSPLAPTALVRLGQMMRNSRRSEAAAKLLVGAREQHEATLVKEPSKAVWAAALRYELGMALKESGKYSEAKDIFENALKDFPKETAAAEIPWRIAQCQREAAMEQLLPLRKLFGRRDAGIETHATFAAALDQLRQAGKAMLVEAKVKKDDPDLAAQIAFEAGGCWRTVAEYEAEVARIAAQEEAQRMKQRARQRLVQPATKPATQPVIAAGDAAATEARACYQLILEIAPESATAVDARAVLREMDQARPMREWRTRSMRLAAPSRIELPPVLDLDGSSEFARLEPLMRSNSPDLVDQETASLDDAQPRRSFSFPEEN